MTAIICAAITLSGAVCPGRGGHAIPLPARGGQAEAVLYVRDLPTYHAFVCIHGYEAAWNDPNDPYWGGLQMDRGFMATYGSDMIRRHHGGLANTWTPAEQILVAHRAWETRGFGPWPNTRIPCGV